MINETLLQFDKKTQLFSVNQTVLDGIDFRALAIEKLFNKKYHYIIIKNFISEYTAKNIREFYSSEKSFLQNNNEGNHRLFYYLNSPYRYPRFITSLINHCMVIKNRIYEYHDFYQIYCMIKGVNPKNYREVSRLQNLHSWSSIYWYKNGNSHFRHIDVFGELACFVNFTKKGTDFVGGGLRVEVDGSLLEMDDYLDYGDLVFLDQSQVFHEVLPVQTVGDQIGRMQLYVPTIPPNYMKNILKYEGHPFRGYFTGESLSWAKKITLWLKSITNPSIHYSRKFYPHQRYEI